MPSRTRLGRTVWDHPGAHGTFSRVVARPPFQTWPTRTRRSSVRDVPWGENDVARLGGQCGEPSACLARFHTSVAMSLPCSKVYQSRGSSGSSPTPCAPSPISPGVDPPPLVTTPWTFVYRPARSGTSVLSCTAPPLFGIAASLGCCPGAGRVPDNGSKRCVPPHSHPLSRAHVFVVRGGTTEKPLSSQTRKLFPCQRCHSAAPGTNPRRVCSTFVHLRWRQEPLRSMGQAQCLPGPVRSAMSTPLAQISSCSKISPISVSSLCSSLRFHHHFERLDLQRGCHHLIHPQLTMCQSCDDLTSDTLWKLG